MIQECSFGAIVIGGKRYTSDLIIRPDGRVLDSWRRKKGHRLALEDILELVAAEPEVIVAGTGMAGLVRPEKGLKQQLLEKGIRLVTASNKKAVRFYNELSRQKGVGACFHLTC